MNSSVKKVLLVVGIVVALAVSGYILYSLRSSQAPTPSQAAEGWKQYEDKAKEFKYSGFVENKNGNGYAARGGTWRQSSDSSSKTFSSNKATLNLSGGAVYFDQIKVGFLAGPRRTPADVSIDGKKIGTMKTYNATYKKTYQENTPWTSPEFECGLHTITVVPKQPTPKTPTAVLQLDYIDVHTCTPSGGTGQHLICTNNACALSATATADDEGCVGKAAQDTCTSGPGTTVKLQCKNNACVVAATAASSDEACVGKNANDECGPSGTTPHLICKNNACATSATAARDDQGCIGKTSGATCGGSSTDDECQGNANAPAKCFDCKRDTTTLSQINNLDFSCFAKYYDEEVGTE